MAKLSKKIHFNNILTKTKVMVWDLEYKRFETQEMREEVRQEHDSLKSVHSSLVEQIKEEKKKGKMSKNELEKLDEKKELMEKRDIVKAQEQLTALDLSVQGSKPCSDYPEGVQGINDQLDTIRILQGRINKYLKSL